MIRVYQTIAFTILISISLTAQNKFKHIEVGPKKNTTEQKIIKKTYRESSEENVFEKIQNFKPLDLSTKNSLLQSKNFNQRGLPSFIEGNLSADKQEKSFADQAGDYLEAAKVHMKINDDLTDFIPKTVWTDKLDQAHQKFDQTYKGIPIYGAEIILHTDSDGHINLLNGNYYSSDQLDHDHDLVLTALEAQDIVRSTLKNYRADLEKKLKSKAFKIEFDQWKTDLVLYPDEGEIRISYHIEVYANLGDFRTFIVDATNGTILNEFSNICSIHGHGHSHSTGENNMTLISGPETATASDLVNVSQTINTYSSNGTFYLIDISRSMFDGDQSRLPDDANGVIGTLDAKNTAPQSDDFRYDDVKSNNNSWSSSREGVSAHFNAGRAYEYFNQVHGRESTNNKGANILSFVNVADEDGGSMENAYWNGLAIWYGNGGNDFLPLAIALDVAGHEITHGVVQEEANLTYQGESGALNESFSDIFGTMIERQNWSIGEAVMRRGGALRNMADPHNGASRGDFGNGWQPKHYDERYMGREDNGGVHLNSGIPNHAYFLFQQAIGDDIQKAEQVFYRALTTYLTKSSKFIDARNAVVQSAKDLYGNDVADAAANAFDQVGIGEGAGGSYQEDVVENTGGNFIVYTPTDQSKLVLIDDALTVLADPLSNTEVLSKPSVADSGDDIVFVGKDNQIHNIIINWATSEVDESIISNDPIWRNAVISKNGRWVAAMEELDGTNDNEIFIVDLVKGIQKTFTLSNPTFTNGVSTGEVLYADAMEFDFTNHTLIYDAINRISSTTGADIEYWDIGFLEFWDPNTGDFAEGKIEKLFAALPEGINVGNPTYSKNSPHIIALDYLDENEEDGWEVLGVNIETGDIETIKTNGNIGYPNYSKDDNLVVHNGQTNSGTSPLNVTEVDDSKIQNGGSTFNLVNDGQWGVWFSNGERDFISGVFDTEVITDQLTLFPNPVADVINITFNDNSKKLTRIEIFDIAGKKILSKNYNGSKALSSLQLSTIGLDAGVYSIVCTGADKVFAAQFVKN